MLRINNHMKMRLLLKCALILNLIRGVIIQSDLNNNRRSYASRAREINGSEARHNSKKQEVTCEPSATLITQISFLNSLKHTRCKKSWCLRQQAFSLLVAIIMCFNLKESNFTWRKNSI